MENKIESFADGSTITTDAATGNRTVFGKMAHEEYFRRLRFEETARIKQSKPASHNFFTKEQAGKLLSEWRTEEPLPAKGKKLVVVFPRDGRHECSRIEVCRSAHKSTYGKPLYLFEFYRD